MFTPPRMTPIDQIPVPADGAVPHPHPFVVEFRVESDQVSDVVDHVTNVACVGWLDRSAELHADFLGFTRQNLLDAGMMWFVARHEVDYLAEARLDDTLQLATWVRDIRRVKSWRDTVVVRPEDGRTICRASTLWVLVSLDSRRPIRFTPAMHRALSPIDAGGAESRRSSGHSSDRSPGQS